MTHRTFLPVPRQVGSLQRSLTQAPGLPIAPLLDSDQVRQAIIDEGLRFRDRLFSPLVTLWVFLTQVLDPDHSCRQAVARLLGYRASQQLPSCSPNTGAYCRARQRLPESLLARLTRRTGWQPLADAPVPWLWKGRDVKIVDGTTASMPDTPANQAAYPQPRSQRPGLGFPLVRMVVIFSLAVGTVLDAAFAPYRGKLTGETALFRALHQHLEAGDILLADRYYCSYFEIALARQRRADVVMRMHQRRRVDFRTGERLGQGDHVVVWSKPQRPDWLTEDTYQELPDFLLIREVYVRVRQAGFRTQSLVVVTTLLHPGEVSKEEIADLYRARWQAELDLRSLKTVLQMDVLRGKSPELVRKEIWAHLLVYNVIRTVMARAAEEHGVAPLEVSFKGALQTINAFLPFMLLARGEELARLCEEMLWAISEHRVGDRPDRYEPRAKKRRPKEYPLLTVPRDEARARLAAGTCD